MAVAEITKRDYSLVGLDTKRAEAEGLATAEWYHTPIPRKRLKELMQRSDEPAIRDTIIWIAAFVVTGVGGFLTWGTWWSVPFFIVYGALYGSSTNSRWHECGHRTAFRTKWMNDVIYQVASFMMLREPEVWRWSHTRHHTDTIIVGRDPEIAVPRPPKLWEIALAFFGDHAGQGLFQEDLPACDRAAHRRGEDLHPRVGVGQGLLHRAHPSRDLRGGDRAGRWRPGASCR